VKKQYAATRIFFIFSLFILVVSLILFLSGINLAAPNVELVQPKVVAPVETPAVSTPEISFADGVPIPPNVRPVIIVSGTDEEMGFQWFQQYAQIFGIWKLKELQQTLTSDQMTYLKYHETYIRQFTPWVIPLFQGMAAGATAAGVRLDYWQVMAEFFPPRKFANIPSGAIHAGRITEDVPDACSGFAAWGSATKDKKLVIGSTGDSNLVKFEHIVMAYPKDGYSFTISLFDREERKPGRAWTPCHPGMNNKGLAYVHHGGGESGNEPALGEAYGIQPAFAVMNILRYCTTAKEALQKELAYPNFQRGTWVDLSGDNFVLECRNPQAVRRAGDNGEKDFIYSTNNLLSKNLEPFIEKPATFIPHAGWVGGSAYTSSSISRNLQLWNLLNNYHGKIDVSFVKMMLRYPGKPPEFPTLEAANAAGGSAKGWNSMVGNLQNEMVGVMVPDNGPNGLFWVSSFRVARVAYPQGPTGHYYPVEPTFTFYQVKLDANPAKVVDAAIAQAQYDLYYADQELRKLTYRDTAYAPLNGLFNKAATEWIKGQYYAKLGRTTTGNNSVNNYGAALRAFARCQAYAKQVYESLVPPPNEPNDLGLSPAVGHWEVR
jgi:hypothetical protein